MSQITLTYVDKKEMKDTSSSRKGIFRSKEDKIMDRFESGDEEGAFKLLYDYFPKIEKMLLGYGASEDDARDIFQEALIILSNKVHQPDFEIKAKISTYLYSMCRFMCKDVIKSKKHTVDIDQFHTLHEEVVTDHEQKEEQFEQVDEILKQLGEKCMRILIGYYYKKKSMKALAEEFGYATVNSAKNQKYKCLERAKKMAIEINQNVEL